jgi:hypothetical protein
VRKGKGCICVDCTNRPSGPDTLSSINTWIPKPHPSVANEGPPIFYQTAFTRYLIWLWHLRGTIPAESILQHCDDLDADFRRVLYNPDLAPVFASIFELSSEGAFLWVLTAHLLLFKDSVVFSTEQDNYMTIPTII